MKRNSYHIQLKEFLGGQKSENHISTDLAPLKDIWTYGGITSTESLITEMMNHGVIMKEMNRWKNFAPNDAPAEKN